MCADETMLITSRSGCRIHLRASAVRHHHSEAIRAEEGSCISRRRGICPYPKRPKVNKQERQRRGDSAKLSGDPYLGPIELDAELFSLGALLLEFSLSCLGSSLSFLEAFFLEESFLLVLLGLLGGGRRHLPLLLRLLWPGSAVPTTCAKNRP